MYCKLYISLNKYIVVVVVVVVVVQFSSVSADECPSLDVGLLHRPPLDHALRNTMPVFYETI